MQPTKHSITLDLTFNAIQGQRSTEIPYMTYYVFYVNFGHNMHHSEDTA